MEPWKFLAEFNILENNSVSRFLLAIRISPLMQEALMQENPTFFYKY